MPRLFPYIFLIKSYFYTANPIAHSDPSNPLPATNVPTTPIDPLTPSRKRPTRTPGLVGTNAAFLVPDHIRKRFSDGWNVHVPLTYLTDRGCLLKDKLSMNSAQNILTIDSANGQISAISKPLLDDGKLDLTFDEWHQAWHRLLDLIKTFLPNKFLMWKVHYSFILNRENWAELWPLYLAYDAEIRKRSVQLPIDPSEFSIGIWNDLETRYTAKKVYSLVQSDLRLNPGHQNSSQPYTPNTRNHQHHNPPNREFPSTSRNPNRNSSFRGQPHRFPQSDNQKCGRCIFCGDTSRSHSSRFCSATTLTNGSPCHLLKHGPSNARQCKSGKAYCYAWNGFSGCDQGQSCQKGEHWCTLCGSKAHNAQQCNAVS